MLDVDNINNLLKPYGITIQKSVSLNNTYLISYTDEAANKVEQVLSDISEIIKNDLSINMAKQALIKQLSKLESDILLKKSKYDLLTLISETKNNFYFLANFFDKN